MIEEALLSAPAAAACLTLSGCSHPQGMEDSPVLFRSQRRGKDPQTDIFRASGRRLGLQRLELKSSEEWWSRAKMMKNEAGAKQNRNGRCCRHHPGANHTTIKDPPQGQNWRSALVFAADVNSSKAISTELKGSISSLSLTFPPARFELEILFCVLTPECVCTGKELMALTVLKLSETPCEAPPKAVITVSYLSGTSWPGPLRPGAKSPRIVRHSDRYASPKRALLTVSWRMGDVGWFKPMLSPPSWGSSEAMPLWTNVSGRMDGGGLCSAGEGVNVGLQGYKADEKAQAAIFSPSKSKKGWKEQRCQENGLNKEIRVVLQLRTSVVCLCVTSVPSHHIRWAVRFNGGSRLSLGSPDRKRPLLLIDFKDFCEWDETAGAHENTPVRKQYEAAETNLIRHSHSWKRWDHFCSSVIQPQRLWCEKGGTDMKKETDSWGDFYLRLLSQAQLLWKYQSTLRHSAVPLIYCTMRCQSSNGNIAATLI